MHVRHRIASFLLLVSTACEASVEDELAARIVGGQAVDIADHPYQVSLTTADGHACGGAIVDAAWVLTAAHCVHEDGGEIVAGASRLSAAARGAGQHRVVTQAVVHPGYTDVNRPRNDLALLHVDPPFSLVDDDVSAIRRVTIARASAGDTDPGVVATATGWGALFSDGPMVDTLRAVDLPIVAHAEAVAAYGGWLGDDALAAGGEAGRDACQGDSGGPLVVFDDDGEPALAGIVSWGGSCGVAGEPGIYTRVSTFDRWIESIVRSSAVACGPDEWACEDGGCIDSAWTCDGGADCLDGSDEVDCEDWVCGAEQVLCDVAWCIPWEWVCDGEVDCDDETDEVDCADGGVGPPAFG